jgi:HlyD family secretion protein
MKHTFLRRILPWLIVACIAGFTVYKLNVKPAELIVPKVTQNTNADEVMGTGTLEARVKTTVSARIQERLAEVLVDQGGKVKAGQLLARLDDAEIKQQVAIAEATLAAARQTAERVSAVLAQARLDHKRLIGLLASNAVSQTDTDKAVARGHCGGAGPGAGGGEDAAVSQGADGLYADSRALRRAHHPA